VKAVLDSNKVASTRNESDSTQRKKKQKTGTVEENRALTQEKMNNMF
jgi:hypothetical protein